MSKSTMLTTPTSQLPILSWRSLTRHYPHHQSTLKIPLRMIHQIFGSWSNLLSQDRVLR